MTPHAFVERARENARRRRRPRPYYATDAILLERDEDAAEWERFADDLARHLVPSLADARAFAEGFFTSARGRPFRAERRKSRAIAA